MRLLPILLCAAGLPWPAVAVDSGDFHWRGKLKTGDAIELKGVNGNITAEPGTGSEIEVSARKSGRKDNPESVRVEVVEHAGGVDRKSTRLNSSHVEISYAVFCLKK